MDRFCSWRQHCWGDLKHTIYNLCSLFPLIWWRLGAFIFKASLLYCFLGAHLYLQGKCLLEVCGSSWGTDSRGEMTRCVEYLMPSSFPAVAITHLLGDDCWSHNKCKRDTETLCELHLKNTHYEWLLGWILMLALHLCFVPSSVPFESCVCL